MNVIIIPGVCKSISVMPQEIIRIEAIGNYSRVHFADGKRIVVAKVLRWFQHKLPDAIFVRVHRSHLVNQLFIKEVTAGLTTSLLLNSGECIIVSRRRKPIVQSIRNFCGMVA